MFISALRGNNSQQYTRYTFHCSFIHTGTTGRLSYCLEIRIVLLERIIFRIKSTKQLLDVVDGERAPHRGCANGTYANMDRSLMFLAPLIQRCQGEELPSRKSKKGLDYLTDTVYEVIKM